MMQSPIMDARQLCLLVAMLISLELLLALTMTRDIVPGLAACGVAIFSFLSGKRLQKLDESLNFETAVTSSLPAIAVAIFGAIIMLNRYTGWIIWFCVAAGYIAANRFKAAGIMTNRDR